MLVWPHQEQGGVKERSKLWVEGEDLKYKAGHHQVSSLRRGWAAEGWVLSNSWQNAAARGRVNRVRGNSAKMQ